MSSPCGGSSIFLSPTVIGVIEFYSLRSSKKSFKFIQIFQFPFVRFFRFVRYLPDRALHIPETKRIKTIRRAISRCLGGYLSFARNRSRWLRRPLSRLGQSCKHVGSRCSIGSAIDASIIALAYSRFSVGECRGA